MLDKDLWPIPIHKTRDAAAASKGARLEQTQSGTSASKSAGWQFLLPVRRFDFLRCSFDPEQLSGLCAIREVPVEVRPVDPIITIADYMQT